MTLKVGWGQRSRDNHDAVSKDHQSLQTYEMNIRQDDWGLNAPINIINNNKNNKI